MLIKLLLPSTNTLWYGFDNVFFIYGKYSFNVFTDIFMYSNTLLYFVFNVASSTDKLLFWSAYNESWYILYVSSNSLFSDTK